MENITISVRTKYFHIFKEFFFDSFIKHHSEYLKQLNVYVDASNKKHNEKDFILYKELSDKYNFNVIYIKKYEEAELDSNNHFISLLYKSVKDIKGKVISLDDDLIIKDNNFILLMSNLLDDNKIIAQEYFCKSKKRSCMSSWIFGINNENIEYSKKDFFESDAPFCDGVSTNSFTENIKEHIYYFNNDIEIIELRTNYCNSKYYEHLSYKSCFHNKVLDRI